MVNTSLLFRVTCQISVTIRVTIRTKIYSYQSNYEVLGWKLSPVVFYRSLTVRNTTGLSFQPNNFRHAGNGRQAVDYWTQRHIAALMW